MPPKQSNQSTLDEPPSSAPIEPVRKSIRVRASAARAFQVFTPEMDTWWPHTHHIGNSPMRRIVVEPHVGGTIYTEQEDGTNCPWASVLEWEPPHRFVMAWQVTPSWKFQPDLTLCSEVELRFIPTDDGSTLVELEHRELHRHGEGADTMRTQINAEGGWGGLLVLFARKAEEAA